MPNHTVNLKSSASVIMRRSACDLPSLAAALLCLAAALACQVAVVETGPGNLQPSPHQTPSTRQPSGEQRATPEPEANGASGAMPAPSTSEAIPTATNISRWTEPPPRVQDLPQWMADTAIDDYLRETGGIMSPLSAARKPHPNRDALKLLEHPAALEDCVYTPMADLRRQLATMAPEEAEATVKEQGEYRHARMLKCLLQLEAQPPPTPVPDAELERRYNAAVLPALIGSHIPLGHLKNLAEQDRPDARRFYRQAQREIEQCQKTLIRGYWSRETAADRILWDRAAIFDCREDHEAASPAGRQLKEPTPFPEATPAVQAD